MRRACRASIDSRWSSISLHDRVLCQPNPYGSRLTFSQKRSNKIHSPTARRANVGYGLTIRSSRNGSITTQNWTTKVELDIGPKCNGSNKMSVIGVRWSEGITHGRSCLLHQRKKTPRPHVRQFWRLMKFTCQWMQFPHQKDSKSGDISEKQLLHESTKFSGMQSAFSMQVSMTNKQQWLVAAICGSQITNHTVVSRFGDKQ